MPTALITGASRGFGHALAGELARRGWRLVIDATTESDLMAAAAGLRRLGTGDIVAVAGDVTDSTHRAELIRSAAATGDFELLVNNASLLGPSPQPTLSTYPIEMLRRVYEVNVIAPLELTQIALPYLREAGGTVVNISSDAAVEGYEGWGGYGSSKAALDQLSHVLATEEPGIRVYWFDPGDMRTKMHQEAFPDEDISDRPVPESRVPGLIHLLDERPSSGRYTAEQFLAGVTS